jgi:hypothetical protein
MVLTYYYIFYTALHGLQRKSNVSIKEDLNIYEVLIDSIREKTSASNEPICDKCKLDFDKHSGQQTVFELFESASDLFY